MSDTKQPEAVSLARELDLLVELQDARYPNFGIIVAEAAAELRRLHAENDRLQEAKKHYSDYANLQSNEALAYQRRIRNLEAELVAEAARTAEATLRANQAAEQHRMQCNMRAPDALDAARYRWLRAYPNNVSAAVYGPTGGLLRRDAYLDAAIDAASAAKGA